MYASEPLIQEELIDPRALNIVANIQKAGYEAYLVGGCLRDLLLGKRPKDFDIATNAHPEQIARLFRNSRLIGRRFRLVHIFFGREVFEVATFRRDAGDDENVRGDNCYGDLSDDVQRRDFTINALYYDPQQKRLIDRVDALNDLKNGWVRIIGDASLRYQEDPVRMLRALRFVAKLNLQLEGETAAAIPSNRKRLLEVPSARLLDECQKAFLNGYGHACFLKLREYQLFGMLFPDVERVFKHPRQDFATYSLRLVEVALQGTDQRVQEGKSVTIAFLFAAFLWPLFQLQYAGLLRQRREYWHDLLNEATDLILVTANERVSIPLRVRNMIREIWLLQARLELSLNQDRKMRHVLSHPRFRAAYDFLLLRHAAGEPLAEACEAWTAIQSHTEALQGERRAAERRQQILEEDDSWLHDD